MKLNNQFYFLKDNKFILSLVLCNEFNLVAPEIRMIILKMNKGQVSDIGGLVKDTKGNVFQNVIS